MQLSTAYKQRLVKAARVASAGAIVVSSVGAAMVQPALAVNPLNSNSTTLLDSRPSATSVQYTIAFAPPSTDTTAINRVDIKVCNTPDTYGGTCVGPTGFDFGTVTGTTAAGFGAGGATAGTPTKDSANTMHFVVTTPASETTASHTIVIPAVTNPTNPATYYVRVQTASDSGGASPIDNGESAFAIVNSVQLSGRVLESLAFTVTQVPSATQCGTGADTSTISTTTTTVPFGNFNAGTPIVGCQKVKTATNALTGYTTTLKEVLGGASPQGGMCRQTATNCSSDGGQAGVSSSDVIVDGGLTSTPAAWGSNTGIGVGVNGAEAASFGGATNYRSIFGATPITIASKSSPSTGVDTFVVYKADVSATQTAGVYQNSVNYVTTPTF